MARKKKEDTRRPHQIITDMCRLLESFGVTGVVCEYSGKDYEGEFTSMCCYYDQRDETGAKHFERPALYNDPQVTAAISARSLRDIFRELSYKTDTQPAIVDETEIERIHDAFYALLPAGWHEDAGGYGEIRANTVTGKIEIFHTRRVIEEYNQKFTYEIGIETPTIADEIPTIADA